MRGRVRETGCWLTSWELLSMCGDENNYSYSRLWSVTVSRGFSLACILPWVIGPFCFKALKRTELLGTMVGLEQHQVCSHCLCDFRHQGWLQSRFGLMGKFFTAASTCKLSPPSLAGIAGTPTDRRASPSWDSGAGEVNGWPLPGPKGHFSLKRCVDKNFFRRTSKPSGTLLSSPNTTSFPIIFPPFCPLCHAMQAVGSPAPMPVLYLFQRYFKFIYLFLIVPC